MPAQERLTIRIKPIGNTTNTAAAANPMAHSNINVIDGNEAGSSTGAGHDAGGAGADEDHLGDDEGGDLVDDVDKFLDKEDEEDEEDAPDWFFEEGEVKSPDPTYVFCPAPHRRQILHLFTKHFCQHPLFPEHDRVKSADCIRRDAV